MDTLHATQEQFNRISKEFTTKVGRLSLFTKHGPEIGRSHEIILSNFLSRYLPKSVNVSTGFIYHPKFGVSPQIDVIIWNNADYAPLFNEGQLVVLRPDSVIVAIEVKTTLDKKSLISALRNLDLVSSISKQNNNHIWTCIFAFGGNINTTVNHMLNIEKINNPIVPQQIIVLNKFIMDYKLRVHGNEVRGHKLLLREGKNNFPKDEAFSYFYASLTNWIGRAFDAPPKKRATAEQLEEYFDFSEKFWSKQTIKVGSKEIIEDSF